jgi:endo-1,4-beta-xylanase
MTAAIRKNRTAQATLTLTGPEGKALADRTVKIVQTRHQFLFGTDGLDLAALNGTLAGADREAGERRLEKTAALFNSATLPFYWARFEPERGKPKTDLLLGAARRCADLGLRVKGHPLCWHTLTADWLLQMTPAEILAAQTARIERDVTAFRDVIDMWDVINEPVIMPIFDKYDNGMTRLCRDLGRIRTVAAMFAAARAANPKAVLLINDFDVSPAYDILVEGCLAAGVRFDAIGIQSHMHQGWWGVEKTQRVLSHFERFGLPIYFSETTLVSGRLMPPEIEDLNDYQVEDWPSTPDGEERQACEAGIFYSTLFAHPLVAGITWWDLSDGAWLNAPAGLLRKDGSAKPVYDELLRLVKGEWWTSPQTLRTDREGKVRITGFLGEYQVSCEGSTQIFQLEKPGEVNLRLDFGSSAG